MKEKSIVELNWIRALAAVGVILYHYTTRYPELFSSNIVFGYQFSWGRAGVNTFFLLSGFLSLYNLNEHITGVAYIRKRVKKLYPEYWICMALTAITELLFLKAFFPGGAALAVNMTMLQGFLGIKNVDGAYWTLAYELRFYALIFFLMFIKKICAIKWVSIAWVLLSLLYSSMDFNGSLWYLGKIFDFICMPEFCAPFSAGIFLFYLFKEYKDRSGWIGLICSLLLSFRVQDDSYFIALCMTIFAILLIKFIREHSEQYQRLLDKIQKWPVRSLSLIAEISYPLYLLHQYIGYAILQKAELFGAKSEWVIILPIFIISVLAVMIHRFVWRKK